MADTTFDSALNIDQWSSAYMREYVRANQFKPYMGTEANAIIQLVNDLKKKPGDQITVQFTRALSGSAITGDNLLFGNEEALLNYGHQISINQRRNAVKCKHFELSKGNINIPSEARIALSEWSTDDLRNQIISALGSCNVDGKTAYASCSEAQKDAWAAANDDRILYGAAVGNDQSGDHSASLSQIDNTNDTLDKGIISLMKRIAKTASPKIRPLKVGPNGDYYVAFTGSLAFRDLKADMVTTWQNAQPRSNENPLFIDGAILYDNVMVVEVEDIGVISGVGDSSIDVQPIYLCGAQAVGVAWGEMPHPVEQTWDYGNQKGVGIAETRGVEKLMSNSVQHGVVTGFVSGVADS